MADEGFRIVLVDPTTAATLASILPVLLLTLAVELRRTALIHNSRGRIRILGLFLFVFEPSKRRSCYQSTERSIRSSGSTASSPW